MAGGKALDGGFQLLSHLGGLVLVHEQRDAGPTPPADGRNGSRSHNAARILQGIQAQLPRLLHPACVSNR